MIENLRHFKALAETGEIPRNQDSLTVDRGLIGKMKESPTVRRYHSSWRAAQGRLIPMEFVSCFEHNISQL